MPAQNISVTANYVDASPVSLYEAENATIINCVVKDDENASGGQYVDGNEGGNITWSVTVASSGSLPVDFRVSVPGLNRSMGIFVNGSKQGVVTCSSTSWETQTFNLTFNSGNNTIELRDSEGKMELNVDYLEISIPTTFTLTVNNGSGDGTYGEGAVVSISADTAQDGYFFSGWSGDISFLTDPNSAETTVTMPAQDVTIAAEYIMNPLQVVAEPL